MPVALGALTLDPPVFLAPMAGVTDLPFRQLVSSFGAGLVVSEMVASQEMVQAKPGVRQRAELGFGEAATSVQLAGRDAHWMGEAARMIEANGALAQAGNIGNTIGTPIMAAALAGLGYAALPLLAGLAFAAGLAVHLWLEHLRR